MLWKPTAVVILLAVALSRGLAADDPFQEMDARAQALVGFAGQPVNHWRFTTADVPNGQSADLDDSSWSVSDVVEFTWGETPRAWLRTTVTVPRDVNGERIEGGSVIFTCGVDDDGVLYVNGKEVQRFHWGDGRAVLTEHAKPGERFAIAVKGINTGGPGRLLFSRLEFGGPSEVFTVAREVAEKYRQACAIYAAVDAAKRAPYLPVIQRAMRSVDPAAIKDDRVEEFIASAKGACAQLDSLGELVEGITAHLVGHAHIDMNWLWLWPETVEVCRSTFSTMCDLMNEYPDFRFSQSQPATYIEMQKRYPAVFARIKEAVKRGQWDPIATNWTEGDNNMSSGEAIVRSILYGKRYMKRQFGTESVVCWEPDTFGHPWTLPQILAKSGIKYYYFMRANSSGAPLFWWQGPDGSKVLAYSYDTYNADVEPGDLLRDALQVSQASGVPHYMRVYGVGDHGGGPTRDMLRSATALQSREGYPKVIFSTPENYFKSVIEAGHEFPVHDGELNTVFEGCYTTHSEIKRWNRESENLIPCAEKFASLAANLGGVYPVSDFEQSWRKTCFNQFHDLLCGSAIHGSYDHSRKLYEEAIGQAGSTLDRSLKVITRRISTTGPGVPIVVFNPLSWARTDVVEVASPFPGERTDVKVTDSGGRAHAAQMKGSKLCFTARDVPALGYKVFWVNRVQRPAEAPVRAGQDTIENRFYRVEVDPSRGVISGIYDKLSKCEVLPVGAQAALPQILMEDPHGMSAWSIGHISDTREMIPDGKAVVTDRGPARAAIALGHSYGKSRLVQEVTLYDEVPRIDIRLTADWQELGSPNKPAPMLKLAFPTGVRDGAATFEIPFGSIHRPANGAEAPAQKWIDLSGGGYGVSLLNNCKYGFDVNGSTIRATLLRASYDPDPTPDQGAHDITLSLYPHKGDWRSAGTTRRACELNEPLIARVAEKHSGTLPAARSFVSLSEPNLIVTALKRGEDNDGWILRFYETDGKACTSRVSVGLPTRYVVETDLMERPVGEKTALIGGCFRAVVGKHEIKTYKLTDK